MDDKKKPSRKPDWTLHQMLIIVLCLQGAAAFFQIAALILTLIRLTATATIIPAQITFTALFPSIIYFSHFPIPPKLLLWLPP